jgi:hypothetical protein
MALKDKIKEALGEDYRDSDDIIIEQLEIYYKIFKKAHKDLENDGGYRRMVSATADPNIRPNGNERYYMNIAFTAMNECAKQIRATTEMLGLSKKGKKLEITQKVEKTMSLLDQMNSIPDE